MTKQIIDNICVRKDSRGYHYLLQKITKDGVISFKNIPIDTVFIGTILVHQIFSAEDLKKILSITNI